MNGLADLLALLAATSASFYFSGIETGIYALNRVRLRLRTEEEDPATRRVLRFCRHPQMTISTILIGNHTANYLATLFCLGYVTRRFDLAEPEVVNTLILTPFLFLFGEIVPKDLFRIRAETLVYRWSRPLALAGVVLRPLAWLLFGLGRISRALPAVDAPPEGTLGREQLADLVREVAEDGVLTEEQNRMVRNVLRVSTLPVRDAMVPLERVDTVPAGFTRADLIAASARNGHSRLPVREPGSGRLVGIVSVLDLVFGEGDPEVRAAPEFGESETVEQALHGLRRARRTMGIVTDANGVSLGIVTVKDLVEEVSGELPAF